MNSSACSPSRTAASSSAKMTGSRSTIRWAARAAAANRAVWLGRLVVSTPRTIADDFPNNTTQMNFSEAYSNYSWESLMASGTIHGGAVTAPGPTGGVLGDDGDLAW